MSIDFIRSDLWTRFSDSLKVVIKTLIDLNSSDEYEKWIIIPTFPYKDNESCGEIFYKNRETELHGIKLVEMDEHICFAFFVSVFWDTFHAHNLLIELAVSNTQKEA